MRQELSSSPCALLDGYFWVLWAWGGFTALLGFVKKSEIAKHPCPSVSVSVMDDDEVEELVLDDVLLEVLPGVSTIQTLYNPYINPI